MSVKRKFKGAHIVRVFDGHRMTGSSIVDGVRIFSQEDLTNVGLYVKTSLKFKEVMSDEGELDSSNGEEGEFVANIPVCSQSPVRNRFNFEQLRRKTLKLCAENKDESYSENVSDLGTSASSSTSDTLLQMSNSEEFAKSNAKMELKSQVPQQPRGRARVLKALAENALRFPISSTFPAPRKHSETINCECFLDDDIPPVQASSSLKQTADSTPSVLPDLSSVASNSVKSWCYKIPPNALDPLSSCQSPWPPRVASRSPSRATEVAHSFPSTSASSSIMGRRSSPPRSNFFHLPQYDLRDMHSFGSDITFIDTHCHLDFLFKRIDFKGTYTKYRRVNEDSYPSCYEGCVAVFCDPSTFGRFTTWRDILSEDNVWGAFGCHPHMAHMYDNTSEEYLKMALSNHNVVALGEIGLDYSAKNFRNHDLQKQVFRRQLRIAVEKQIPLVIHSRDADQDTLDILKEEIPYDYKFHRHCFTGSWNEARQWLSAFPNSYLGLTPVVTYPTATPVHDVARNIPLHRLLLETDAPYFVPRNISRDHRFSHPGMAIHVAGQVASLRNDTTLKDILQVTRDNTRRMYGI